MQLLSDENKLWDLMYGKYGFNPQTTKVPYNWIQPPSPFVTFILPEACWNEEQEKLVNSFFVNLNQDEVYALDWQHDCFTYDPKEEIPLHYSYRDDERQCSVYFPSYYPDGDYYFFFDPELKYGLFGHPWLGEIVVTGEGLIKQFENNSGFLGILRK